MGDHQRLREQFYYEMTKENKDVKFLIESIKTKINEMSDFANENMDLVLDFYESLDATQQRIVMDEIKYRMDQHHS